MIDKVVFLKYKNGAIIAIFPRIPWDRFGHQCTAYMHFGQHWGVNPGVICQTKLATPTEYADLAKELRARGYKLKIGRKVTYEDFIYRKKLAMNSSGGKP